MRVTQQIFLLATDFLSDEIINSYRSLRQATKNMGETCILLHQKNSFTPPQSNDVIIHTFTDSILNDLNFTPIVNSLIPGSNHFSLLHFFRNNPPFQYYWYIENDVVFNGNWADFFEPLNALDFDFLSSNIMAYNDKQSWDWWMSLHHPHQNIPVTHRLCSLNPVYRMSFEALSFINDALQNKWKGHHEVLIPTLLYNNNFKIMDFGGRGYFAPPEYKNRFYTSQTFRWRPVFKTTGYLKNKLYHPVK